MTTCGELGPVLASSVQEGCGQTGASPEKGHERGLRIGVSLIQEEAERDRIIQPGESSGKSYLCA